MPIQILIENYSAIRVRKSPAIVIKSIKSNKEWMNAIFKKNLSKKPKVFKGDAAVIINDFLR